MAVRYYKKLAVLGALEGTYGVDANPTGGANAMLMTNVTLTPLAGEEVSRELMLPYLGHQGVMLTGTYVELRGEVEMAGSGTAGTPPAYAPLLKCCGLAETITAVTKVEYTPAALGAHAAASLYANLDGVNHKMFGARGTFTFEIAPKRIPRFVFTLRGLLGAIGDVALPAVDVTAFRAPVPASKATTPVLTLHGISAPVESLSFDLANDVQLRDLINWQSIEIVDRQSTGSVVMQADSVAAKNWFGIAQARDRGALSLQHGTAVGNKVLLDAPAVEIGRPTYGQTQNINNMTLPLMFCPVSGNDEFKITIQ